jgi:hypothetical protein
VEQSRRPVEAKTQIMKHCGNARPTGARAVDRQPRGLVDHDRLGVYIDDPIGQHGCRDAMPSPPLQMAHRAFIQFGLMRGCNESKRFQTFRPY